MNSVRMGHQLQKPDSNRPDTPYEGAAFPVEPFCIVIAGTGVEPAIFSV